MKPLETGAKTRFRAMPSKNETASALGNTGVDVVSTQALIIYLEHACHSLMAPNYQTGEGSVGYKVDVAHLAPAFLTLESSRWMRSTVLRLVFGFYDRFLRR